MAIFNSYVSHYQRVVILVQRNVLQSCIAEAIPWSEF